ncbi:BZ3500_MvSof-1268-A1-R1_Chr5-3g08182 [Microbotryum saponariae]|uniref:BZ3500_MvSof-1268-A1-R1_Chr5-3g08182 protein n=1 Tax=Microbotryum saponariae TaxID=289078 RepID=A0A2X0LLC7_9BASI|nr:BZ3500_MvSof-1268-A1-R1_Chr5-3g08182 [Microbotryum saponariae]SDA07941.1 BZ3501_MvSof-1269-A2-R1_Chr5-1g07326 [Microbotryum saponariae]
MSLTLYEPRSISVITLCLSFYYLLSSSVLGALLAIRALSIENLQRWPMFKILTCLALLAAYLFVFAEAVLVLGLQGAHSIVAVCVTGTWLCIILYMIFKLVYYVFLMERVHLVYSSKRNIKLRRLRAPWYRFSLVVVVAWAGVAIAMVIGRIVETSSEEDICVSGVRPYASIALLVVDASVCTVLTLAFALPVWRSRFSKAQRLALTSCIATGIGTLASFGNLLWMTHAEGREKRWVRGFSSSLDSKSGDFFISAVLTFIITNAGSKPFRPSATAHPNEASADRKDDSTSSPGSHQGRTMTQVPVRPLDGVVITSHVVEATEEDDDEKEEDHDLGMDHKSAVASSGWLDRILYERSARRKKSLATVPTAELPFTSNTIMLQETSFSRPQTAPAERSRTDSLTKDASTETRSLRGVGLIEHRACDSTPSSRTSTVRHTREEEGMQMC